jgi:phosphoglycerate-specific signal transduction histidine kinase
MYRADKMSALGQIIPVVAHEINNPNNFIYFNLPILKRYIEAILPILEHHL